jgi:PAS domain S-box-containing protein
MTKEELRRENEALRRQLGEAEEALRALREGRVNAGDIPAPDTRGDFPGRLIDKDDFTTRRKDMYDELERRVEERTAQLNETAELARTERQRLYDVLETLPVYVCLLDSHHNMPFANRLFREWFGYQPTRKCYEFLFNRSEPCEPCGTYEVLRTREPHRWEWTGPNGRRYDIFDFPFQDTDGSPLILEMGIDITERTQAEQELKGLNETLEQRISQRTAELRQSREDLARAQAVGQIGWWRLDTLNNVLTWSAENYRIFGVPEGTPLTYEAFLATVHPDDRQYVDSRWLAGLRGEPYDIEHRIVIDGRVKWVREKAYLEFDDKGELRGGFGITQDITPRKQAEEEVRIARDALEVKVADRTAELARMVETLREEIRERHRAEEALYEETDAKLHAMEELRKRDQLLLQQSRLAAMGEMINNIAHQWRQPLNLLGLNVQKLLLYYDLGDFDRNLLASSIDDTMSLVNHMSQTIDDFRTFFRTDREKISFDIRHAVEKTLSLVRDGLTATEIQLKVSVAEGITITGYENEFCQVLMNLLLNARDALIERRVSPGEIIMTVESCEGVCRLTIGDNAGGIPEEILDRIFEPYFSTKGLQGTGIGLYMSKQIIETNMGGRLSVRNTPCGAEFIIEI